jgi:hypothetical protein
VNVSPVYSILVCRVQHWHLKICWLIRCLFLFFLSFLCLFWVAACINDLFNEWLKTIACIYNKSVTKLSHELTIYVIIDILCTSNNCFSVIPIHTQIPIDTKSKMEKCSYKWSLFHSFSNSTKKLQQKSIYMTFLCLYS